MAQIAANPWSFTNSDQATTVAITSIVRNGQGSATITTTAPHGLLANALISVQGASPARWNGGYRILSVPTTTTIIVKIDGDRFTLTNGIAQGNVLSMAYYGNIDVVQMLWDGPTAAGVLSLTDQYGNLVWNPTAITGGTLTYMKAFPVNGLVINALPSGTLQISI